MNARARGLGLAAVLTAAHLTLVWRGRTSGSTCAERASALPGDELVDRPTAVTDHAITIDAAPADVWPWLVQMGWRRGGWYTARWVDRLFFPDNGPSATTIIPELQERRVGDFIPDGAPATGCGLYVEALEPERVLVLRSTSHLPARWRRSGKAALDWSWVFVLRPVAGGARTRFHFRSRWWTRPWWLTLGGWVFIVPADHLMAQSMLRGVRQRAEALAAERALSGPSALSSGDGSRKALSEESGVSEEAQP